VLRDYVGVSEPVTAVSVTLRVVFFTAVDLRCDGGTGELDCGFAHACCCFSGLRLTLSVKTKNFVLRWTLYTSLVVRDLTLRSAPRQVADWL
jgi:hypothetical protein